MADEKKINSAEVHRAMRGDYKHDAGKFWNRLTAKIGKRLDFANFKRGFAARHYSAYSPELTMYRTAMWLFYQRVVDAGGADYLTPERHAIGDAETLKFKEHEVSWEQLLSAYEAMLVHRELGKGFSSCLEIGAGWGRTAEALIQHTPCDTYVIVDLPETLALSHHYLNQAFPDLATNYLETRDGELPEKGILFLLPNQIDRIKGRRFDLGLNINGLQEMPPTEVARYVKLYDETCDSVFFSNKTATYDLDHTIVTDLKDYPIPDHWNQTFDARHEIYDSFVNRIYKNQGASSSTD
jgi:putative sugar O-methyltransferase